MEIPSGGSLAMAGMIQDDTKHNINGLPGLMELPILGPLFKSNDYVNQHTELMVLVTPYVVRAVAQKDLSRPDDGFADPSDPAQVLLGRFNRIYGVGGSADPRRTTITANTDSSSIDAAAQETTMHTVRTHDRTGRRGIAAAALRAALVAGCALLVCACNTDQQVTGRPDVPNDYRLRHPITITEADHTLQLFIGANRGELTPTQRAEVLAFAQTWQHEATGGVLIDLPVGTSNERAAADALREIQSILAATGVPPQTASSCAAIRRPRARSRPSASPIRRSPRKPAPAACGPKTSGRASTATISKTSRSGTSAAPRQRNLAAMVDNPADLVQPRGETPAYTMRRTTVLEKYRTGRRTATTVPECRCGQDQRPWPMMHGTSMMKQASQAARTRPRPPTSSAAKSTSRRRRASRCRRSARPSKPPPPSRRPAKTGAWPRRICASRWAA